jgi:hypothetical protein
MAFPVALAAAVFNARACGSSPDGCCIGAATMVVTLAYFVPRPAGLAPSLKQGHDRSARWFVQERKGDPMRSVSGAGDPRGRDARLGCRDRDTYLYPAWMPICAALFSPTIAERPDTADWLVVGPGRTLPRLAGGRRVADRALVRRRLAHLQT